MNLTEIDEAVDAMKADIEDRINEAQKGRGKPTRFRIIPRYGCGSPADLPAGTVRQGALSDVRAYHQALEGSYGFVQQEEAKQMGLAGIALAYTERACHWDVQDLLTGDTYRQPFGAKKRCKHTRISPVLIDKLLGALMKRADTGKEYVALQSAKPSLTGKAYNTATTRIGVPAFTVDGTVVF